MNYLSSIRVHLKNSLLLVRLYTRPLMLKVMGLGFASALPVALVFSIIIVYLSDSEINLKTVGFFSAISFPFTFKFLWAPLLDNISIPYLTKYLGFRKSWILFLQVTLMITIYSLGRIDIHCNLSLFAVVAVLTAILAASQDIVIDAFRIEILTQEDQDLGGAAASFGYRIGLLAASAGSLFIAHYYGWRAAYIVIALAIIIGMVSVLSCLEVRQLPPRFQLTQAWVRHAFIDPFSDFIKRVKWYNTVLLIIFYKMSDAFAGVMTNPFLLDIGFDKKEIATIMQLYGTIATFLGFVISGAMLKHLGYGKSLFVGCALQMLSNFGYALQAKAGHNYAMLIINTGIEDLASSIGPAILIAYMSHICNRKFTATQFAFFSSLAGAARTTVATYSGALAQHFGWDNFFIFSMVMTSPVLYFLHQEFKVSGR